MITLEKILKTVEEAKKIPNSYIEYHGELPEIAEVTPTSFFGIKAVENTRVPKNTGCSVMFKY